MHLMKNLLFVVLMTLLLVNLVLTEESEKRTSLLTKRAGTRPSFNKASTTTTEANYEEEEYVEEGEQAENVEQPEDESSATSTTAEPAKKIGPVVRPFRSNEELLQALKKRRLSEKNGKASVVTQKPKPSVQEENEPEPEVKTTKSKPTAATSFAAGGNRRFGAQKSTNVKAPVQENQAQTIEDPTSKPFKRSNRFSARQ